MSKPTITLNADGREITASQPTDADHAAKIAELEGRAQIIRDQIQRDKNHAVNALNAVSAALAHVVYVVDVAMDMANANGDDDALIELISAELALEATLGRMAHLEHILTGE